MDTETLTRTPRPGNTLLKALSDPVSIRKPATPKNFPLLEKSNGPFKIIPSKKSTPCSWDDTIKNEHGRTKLSFDFGSVINHPKWGNLNVSSDNGLSFLIEHGMGKLKYYVRDLSDVKPLFIDHKKWWLSFGPDPRPELTDKIIGRAISFGYAFGGMVMDPTSEAMRIANIWAIIQTAFEIFNNSPQILGDSDLVGNVTNSEFVPRMETWLKWEEKIYHQEITQLPADYEEEFECAKKIHLASINFVKEAKGYIEKQNLGNWAQLSKWFWEARVIAWDAEIVEYKLKIQSKYDWRTRKSHKAQIVPLEQFIALYLMLSGVYIPRRLRKCFLWQRLNEVTCFLGASFNSIYRLAGDLQHGIETNIIVLLAEEKEMCLNEALKVHMKQMEEEKSIMLKLIQAFLKVYPEDKDVGFMVNAYLSIQQGYPHFLNEIYKY